MHICFPPCAKLLTKYEALVNMDTYVHKQFLTAKIDYDIQIISIIFVLYYIILYIAVLVNQNFQ